MEQLNWCCTKEDAAYMRMRKAQNIERSIHNPNENWMAERLKVTGIKFSRQAIWGYRLFDFWNHVLGVAIEVDGDEHNPNYDAYRDEYNFRRSAIVVLRARNQDESDADKIIAKLATLTSKIERRSIIGISESSKWLFKKPYPPSYLKAFLEGTFP